MDTAESTFVMIQITNAIYILYKSGEFVTCTKSIISDLTNFNSATILVLAIY